jgi:acyl-homoserine lactone acylase PvdQ
MQSQLIGPTIFYETFSRFKDLVWNDEYEEAGINVAKPQDNTLEYLVREVPDSKWFDNVTTTAVEDRDDIIVEAFIEAIKYLESEFGSDLEYNWEWGEYHRMYFNHLGGIPSLGKGSYEHDGSGYTLLAAGGRRVGVAPASVWLLILAILPIAGVSFQEELVVTQPILITLIKLLNCG